MKSLYSFFSAGPGSAIQHLVNRRKVAIILSICVFPLLASAQDEMVADGNIHSIGYQGSAFDLKIPASLDPSTGYNVITFTLKGADGGRRRITGICTEAGGEGAKVTVSFQIRSDGNVLKPGGTVRFIVGEQGESVRGSDIEGAGGGGGTGILYRDPTVTNNNNCGNSWPVLNLSNADDCWVLLAVAGAGGGAYAPGGCAGDNAGDGGNDGEHGTDGRGSKGGAGGQDGHFGEKGTDASGVYGAGFGGGGYIEDVVVQLTGKGGGFGGGAGGENNDPDYGRGGFGYGGGGAGHSGLGGGGGGGGFSGGGGGASYHAGGGGGSFANAAAFDVSKEKGGKDNTPNHGWVTYQFSTLEGLQDAPVAQCRKNITIGITNESTSICVADVDLGSYDPNGLPLEIAICDSDGDCAPCRGFDCNDIGDTYAYTLKVDNGFQSVSCAFTVEIESGEPSTLRCPDPMTVEIGDCEQIIDDGQTYYEEIITVQEDFEPLQYPTCNTALDFYILRPDNSIDTFPRSSLGGILRSDTFALGTSKVVYIADYEDEDAVERRQTCTFTVTVVQANIDVQCPNDVEIDVEDPSNACLTTLNEAFSDYTADLGLTYDGCGQVSYRVTGPGLDPTVREGSGELDEFDFEAGISTVEYFLVRETGAEYQCSFTVEINKNSEEEPVFTSCPAGQTLLLDVFEGITDQQIIDQIAFEAMDDCGIESIELSNLDPSCDAVGVLQQFVRLRAYDAGGRSSDFCIFNVRTQAREGFLCRADYTVDVDPETCTATLTAAMLAPTQVPCDLGFSHTFSQTGGATLSSGGGPVPAQTLGPGTYVSSYSYKELSGGLLVDRTCLTTITVKESVRPSAICTTAVLAVPLNDLPEDLAAQIGAASTDDCGAGELTFDLGVDISCDNLGVRSVLLTVTDASGNQDFCHALIDIIPLELPAVSCRDVTAYTNGDPVPISVYDVYAGPIDPCNRYEFSFDAAASETEVVYECSSSLGDNFLVLHMTAPDGQVTSCDATVSIVDNVPPSVSCAGSVTVTLDVSGQGMLSLQEINPSAGGGLCDDPMTFSFAADAPKDKIDYDCSHTGTTQTAVLYATDQSGNVGTCETSVTVVDILAPTAGCVATKTVLLDAQGMADLAASDVDDGSTDDCSINMLSLDVSSFSCSDIGSHTVTLTVTDDYGNSNSCTTSVTVVDQVQPVADCKNLTVQLDADGSVTIDEDAINRVSTDACGGLTFDTDVTTFDCSKIGANTVTLTVTDAHGNSNNCTATVTVEDNDAPLANCQDVTVNLSSPVLAPQALNDGSDDYCTSTGNLQYGLVFADSDSPVGFGNSYTFGCEDVGTINFRLEVKDAANNIASCSATVTVVDDVAPTAACRDATIQLDVNGNAALAASDIDNGSTDACGVESRVASGESFNCEDVGSNSVTLTVTDVNGNSADCSATVTIEDNVAPTAVCQDISVQLDNQGNATISGDDIDNNSSDACGIASRVASRESFSCLDAGSHTVTLTVTDVNGNNGSCTAAVTVENMVMPMAVCRNISVQLDENGMAAIAEDAVNGGSASACGGLEFDTDVTGFSCADLGPNTVTLTMMDNDGNSSSCEATVTVEDDLPPVLTCRTNIQLYLDDSGQTSWNPSGILVQSVDNCGVTNTVVDPPQTFTCVDLGDNFFTLTQSDAAGNQSSCEARVVVSDISGPTVMVQDITVQLDAQGQAVVAARDLDGGSTDNCTSNADLLFFLFDLNTGEPTADSPLHYFDCSNIGANELYLGAMDAAGNLGGSLTPAIVTVEGEVSPTALCRNITVQLDAQGQAGISGSDLDDGSFNACGVASLVSSQESFTCADVGDNSVTLTVTDLNGNSTDCSATVTVEDNIAPVAACRNITVQLDAQSNASISVDDIDNGSSDVCGIGSRVASRQSFDCEDVGANSVTLTVTDVSGNSATCTANVTVLGLPCGFYTADIGCSSQTDYNAATGVFTIQTNNCNSTNPASDEQGTIAYRLCGNGSISFHVASLSSQNAFAGIQLRTGGEPGAVKAEVVTNLYFTARGAVREYPNASAWPLPFYLMGRHWLKMERWGNQIRIYTSTNGQTWTILMVRNLTLPNCVYVGMMAYGPGVVTATFDNVVVNGAPLQTGPLQTGPLQTSPEGGGFPLEEAFLKPSTVGRLPSTEAPLPSPRRGETRLTLAVYPNPTTGQLTVELPADLPLNSATLEVLDAYGRSVLHETTLDYQQRLDLSRLPAGAYFVHLLTATGDRIMERVIVGD